MIVETHINLLREIISDTEQGINKYALVGDIEVPKRVIFFMPVFNENELAQTQENMQRKLKGVEIRSLIATNVIVGDFCYKRFDNTDISCSQYQILANEYKIVPWVEPKSYFDKFDALMHKSSEPIELPKLNIKSKLNYKISEI